MKYSIAFPVIIALTLILAEDLSYAQSVIFLPHHDYATSPNPLVVTIGDFNSDGKQDLVTADADAGDVSILIGNGNGTFQVAIAHPLEIAPYAVTAGDYNSDAKQDLAVTINSGSNNARV